jgi:hypothetical protein
VPGPDVAAGEATVGATGRAAGTAADVEPPDVLLDR